MTRYAEVILPVGALARHLAAVLRSRPEGPDLGSQRSGHIQFGRRLLRRLHSVPVDRKRGRITFLDREARTGAATVVSADVGKLSECLGFIPETSAEF